MELQCIWPLAFIITALVEMAILLGLVDTACNFTSPWGSHNCHYCLVILSWGKL